MVTLMSDTRKWCFTVIIGVLLFDWGNYFPYFLKSISINLDIVCSNMNIYQIRFSSTNASDIINEVICCCSMMTSHFRWINARNCSLIYILDHRIAYNKNLFHYHWAICRLLFNQVTIIVVLCTVFLLFSLWEMVCISIFSLVLVVTPWFLEWLSAMSVFVPLLTLGWLSWISRQQWWLSKFELCSSKESTKFCLLTKLFLKNLFFISSLNFLF